MFFQKLLAHWCRFISDLLHIENWSSNCIAEGGALCTYRIYFVHWGPAIAILRSGKIASIMGGFAMRVVYDTKDVSDNNARIISCKPFFMAREKNDCIILGRFNILRKLRCGQIALG